MAGNRIGDYSFPSIRIDRAIQILQRISDQPYRGEISQSGLAQELKMSERGGAFGNLVGSLRDYGLVSGKGTLQVTELGKRIVTGSAEESTRSKALAFLNVPLFKEIYNRIRADVPEEGKFSVLLGEITHEDRLRLRDKAGLVRAFYIEAVKYLSSLAGPQIEGEVPPQIRPPLGVSQQDQFIEVKAGPYYQRLPFNKEGRDTAIKFLESLKLTEVTSE